MEVSGMHVAFIFGSITNDCTAIRANPFQPITPRLVNQSATIPLLPNSFIYFLQPLSNKLASPYPFREFFSYKQRAKSLTTGFYLTAIPFSCAFATPNGFLHPPPFATQFSAEDFLSESYAGCREGERHSEFHQLLLLFTYELYIYFLPFVYCVILSAYATDGRVAFELSPSHTDHQALEFDRTAKISPRTHLSYHSIDSYLPNPGLILLTRKAWTWSFLSHRPARTSSAHTYHIDPTRWIR